VTRTAAAAKPAVAATRGGSTLAIRDQRLRWHRPVVTSGVRGSGAVDELANRVPLQPDPSESGRSPGSAE